MICIILRNIDTETVDYELLLFGYLKVCSTLHVQIGPFTDTIARLPVACGTDLSVY